MLKFPLKKPRYQTTWLSACFMIHAALVSAVDVTIQRDASITQEEFKTASLIRLAGQSAKYDGDSSPSENALTYRNVPDGEYVAVVWNPIVTWAESPLWSTSFSVDGSKQVTLTASRPRQKIILHLGTGLHLAELFPRLDFVPCRIQTINKPFAGRFAYQWVGLKPNAEQGLSAEVALDPGEYVITIPYPNASEGWPPLARFDCPYLAMPFTFKASDAAKDAAPQVVKVSISAASPK